jgi:HK97 family phage portal protein
VRSPVGTLIDRATALLSPRNDAPPYVPASSNPLFSGALRADDKATQLRAMGAVGTLFAIVNRLSVDTAAVDWHMHRLVNPKTNSSTACELCDQPGVKYVPEHPALSVWNRPNDFYTREEFVESEQQHVDLTGEGWWVVAKVGTRPIELWPVRPDRMVPIPHRTKFLAGYVYLGPDGERIPLQLDEVIQIRMPSPWDPYRGMGPVQSILVDLDSTRYSAEWNRNFFLNSAEPGGIIEVDKRLGDDEFDEMTERWREQHQGVSRAHRVAIIEQGKWVDRKFTQRDMQFAELRSVSREIIREAYGMHGHMLGLSNDINLANAQAAETTYAKYQTVPRLGRFKHALNSNFLPMFGDMGKGYEFVPGNPVPADEAAANAERTSKTTAYKTLVDAGVDPEDAALVCGLPTMRHTAPPAPAPVPAGAGAPGASWRPRV